MHTHTHARARAHTHTHTHAPIDAGGRSQGEPESGPDDKVAHDSAKPGAREGLARAAERACASLSPVSLIKGLPPTSRLKPQIDTAPIRLKLTPSLQARVQGVTELAMGI